MQLNMVINDELMQQAKLVAGVKSETEIVEIALRAWLELQHPKKQVENPAKVLLESDFVGCGQADPLLSMKGILLQPRKPFTKTQLADVAGCLEYHGEAKTLEDMEAAIAKGISERTQC